jgi:hypothetical protein
MPNNYVLLEKITVGSAGASSVTFNNIPQTGYTDLVVRMSTRSAAAVNGSAYGMGMTINGVGTNRTYRRLEVWDGTNIGSDTNTNDMTAIIQGNSTTASTFNNVQIYFSNYTSNNNKTFSVEGVNENASTTGNDIYLLAGLWAQTAAITSLAFYDRNGSSNFLANSTFKLYGVAKLNTTPAIAPQATGGDTIMTDGTYWYHAFKASGTFTPTKALYCDLLVVAGGAGGGQAHGGGGGAGGLYYSTSNSVTTTGYTVTVGAGGTGSSTSATGSSGSNSVFGSLTAAVGGGGGGSYSGSPSSAGSNGGSGGGGSNYPGNTAYSGGTATSGQGYAGGSGSGQLQGGGGGGGGGAGAVGSAGTNQGTFGQGGGLGGAGGAGTNTYSAWLSATGTGVSGYIAGGGGGGSYNSPTYNGSTSAAGGSGGGGGGGYSQGPGNYNPIAGTAGTANTGGGGGGGAGNGGSGVAGGSGLVIVRYPV